MGDRFRGRNASSLHLNTTIASNVSAFEDKLSPICKTRHKNDHERLEQLRKSSLRFKIKCHVIILLSLVFDFFVFNSAVLSFIMFFHGFSESVILSIFTLLTIYFTSVIILFAVEIKFPKMSSSAIKALEQLYQSRNQSDIAPRSANITTTEKPNFKLNDSIASSADHSWIDAHKFGTPPVRNLMNNDSFRSSPFNKKSPNTSRMINVVSSDVSPLLDTSISTNWKSPTSYSKPIESIHTRKQLDVLLRSHENDAPVDMTSSQNTYFSSLWSIFDFAKNGTIPQNNSYQLSEEAAEDENGTNRAYKMKIGKHGRTEVQMLRRRGPNEAETEEDNDDELTKLQKIMHSARTSAESKAGILKRSNSTERGIRGRRRSHSSPERSGEFYANETNSRYRNGVLLNEAQQKRAEFRVRAWIRNTIVLPLAEEIDKINKELEKEHASPALRIGSSSIDALKLAAIERDSLKSTNLPFVLPFLAVHTNQAYLVSRIKQLSASEFMDVYKWNSGGMEPTEDKLQSSRIVRREWNDSLPTDLVLLYDIFSVYMDSQLNSNCLVGDNRLDQPFASRYSVKFPRKPTVSQKSPYSFYLNMTSLSPPHVEFIHNDGNGSQVKCSVARQTSNLFRAIAQFVYYVKEENHGYLDQTSIGPSGINISCVLN